MPVRKQVFSFISLLSIAVLIASFQTTSVSALSLDSHHYVRDVHHHDIAKKKRSTKQKRCKSRPAPSSAPAPVSTPVPSKSPAVASAPASSSHPPAAQSSAPAAPPPPPPAPKPTSSAPSKAPQSSSGSLPSLSSIFPNKALLAWGGDSQLGPWIAMDSYYNWSPNPSTQGAAPRWIPMLWGLKNEAVWQSQVLTANPPPLVVKSLNEPELPGQGSISPQDAATLWNKVMVPLIGKSYIGAPAVTSDGGAKSWLNSFFQICNNGHPSCGANYIDIHFYGTDAQGLITFVEDMHSTYGLDVMISEFACQSFVGGAPCTQDQVNEFAATATAFFQSTDYVIAYAAFGALPNIESTGVAATNSMFDGTTENPNSLARIYYPEV